MACSSLHTTSFSSFLSHTFNDDAVLRHDHSLTMVNTRITTFPNFLENLSLSGPREEYRVTSFSSFPVATARTRAFRNVYFILPKMVDDNNALLVRERRESWIARSRADKHSLRDAYTLHPKSRYNIIDITLNVFGIFEIHK